MKIGILRFPGTNCDYDIYKMVQFKNLTPVWLWHKDQFEVSTVDKIIVPGGFSYGDYLRCGALAAKSPVMKSVMEFANKGKPVMGICNGFQILCESKLLPGVLLRNKNLSFIDQWVTLKLQNQPKGFCEKWNSEVSNIKASSDSTIKLPIAHGEGRFFVPADECKKLQDQEQIWFRYDEDVNGSVDQIAGVMNKEKNVCALMPHPERALEEWMGGTDGNYFL